ncbi:MAG: fibrillarin-like rRNA/tRNA 2'-O-methyltransferase [bacterium]|nr:fibrillarin-like rRNA/tRNA 2'-O-methyltransferase [bacterium]
MAKNVSQHYLKKMVAEIEARIPFENELYREAFLSVERHKFIEEIYGYDEHLLDFKIVDRSSKSDDEGNFMRRAYSDSSLLYCKDSEGLLSSISMPSVILAMINLSKMKKGDKVLEIGAGSGYSTALFSKIVGDDGFVCGTEISKDIFEITQKNLKQFSLKNVHIENSDGGFGMVDFAPYDRIIVSCTTADVTEHWINQLKTGGTLVAPLVTRGYQVMVSLKKTDKDVLDGKVFWPVRFFPLSGSFSIISHYSFSSRELKSLKKIIESTSNTDEDLSEEIRLLSTDSLKSFLFFLSIKNPNAICYYPREDVSEGMGYGIFLRTGNMSGFSLLFGSKSVHWGNPEAHSMLKSEFNVYKNLNMPNLHSSRIRVFNNRDDYPVGEKEFLVKRKNSLTLFSFD